jgi:hypothetical protein
MATLGRRDITKKKNGPDPEMPAIGIAAPTVNLGAIPTTIYPVSTQGVLPSFPGSPIMREGFITTTGIMPPPLKQIS